MKRFFSWIVLFICCYIAEIVFALGEGLIVAIFHWIGTLSTGGKIAAYVFGGGSLFSLIMGLIIYVPLLVVSASEAICESKKGTRYIVNGICGLISVSIRIYGALTYGGFSLVLILDAIFYIVTIISGRKKVFADE